jgi:hypothetical protein
MAAKVGEGRWLARWGEASGENAGAQGREAKWPAARGAVLVSGGSDLAPATTDRKLLFEHREIGFTSSGTSICRRRDCPIRKKIIGHRMSIFWKRFPAGNVLLNRLRVLPLPHEPAWPKSFLPSTGREARQFPCGDWRHGRAARVRSFAGSFAKRKEETPMVVVSCSGSQGPPGS